jgi:hypothetical protein
VEAADCTEGVRNFLRWYDDNYCVDQACAVTRNDCSSNNLTMVRRHGGERAMICFNALASIFGLF